jgi:hypothetical protein
MKMLKSRPAAADRPDAAPASANGGTPVAGLLAQSLARQACNTCTSAMLLPLLARPDASAEWLELQAAVVARLLQLQQGWAQGWTAWLSECGQSRGADTLSEHFEHFYNLAAQSGALLKDQAADLADLQDTVQVDYGYWLARKLHSTRE